ncbi:hypothetical protein [Peribacillus kribbensis]|uniref:hypothetical protein n=1 Tax=Peribacillus kribbensis TaxID=356658 RepID=UPI0003FA7490|nr:hypothetical protein [Peribacillus kribbensis]
MEIIKFGKKEEGIQDILRPAVYGILLDSQKGRLALIQIADGELKAVKRTRNA